MFRSTTEGLLPYSALHNEDNVDEDKMMIAFFDFQIQRKHQILNECDSDFLDYLDDGDGDEDDDTETETDDTDTEGKNSETMNSNLESTDSNQSFGSNSTDQTSTDTNTSFSDNLDDDNNQNNSSSDEFSSTDNEIADEKTSTSRGRHTLNRLRNRLRSLRHRQTLNLTEQNDYIDVLDSLRVNRQAGETTTMTTNGENQPPTTSSSIDSNIEIFDSTTQQPSTSTTANADADTDDEQPKKDSTTGRSIRNLNEQKRRIENELDDDEDNSRGKNKRIDCKTTLNDEVDSSDEESQSWDQLFKKNKSTRRMSYRSNKQPPSAND